MRGRPGILTLSWAVDYWDRLGWEDTFADSYNSMRQTAYNKRLGRGGVFTPQLIIDGSVQCIGSKMGKVRKSVAAARSIERAHVQPSLQRKNDKIIISLPKDSDHKMIAVRVVWYQADAKVEIGDGENQGRTLHYTNVVRATELLEEWKGDKVEYTTDLAVGLASGADHVAVLLQEEYGHGSIIGVNYMPISETAAKSR